MAVTFATAEYVLQDFTRANPARLLTNDVVSGDIQVAFVKYTTTTGTDEAATDIINLCKLPIGAIVIPQLCSCFSAVDLGTSIIIDIGQASDKDCFADGIDISAVGQVAWNSGTAPVGAITQTPMLTNDLYATVMTATAPDPGLVIVFCITYKTPT